MKTHSVSRACLGAAAFLALTGPVSAHSWVERAFKIAPNGTMVGKEGFPRGWLPRDSANPPWSDSIPQLILPPSGQSFYSGDEILNKFPKQDNPPFPMLEASAGDFIALMHLENGHTTLPENQPKKPKNRGTLFFYGTNKPKDQEKLFDVHLVWNRDGTGGDRRGKLLATRNYDDGQCYQPNSGELSVQRASKLASDGAVHGTELACQSDIKLPSDLEPGSIYTIYWYWDWPDLNADVMDFEATKNGIFPWAGTFMRGEKDPHGFTMAAIARNESYASTIDIKITEPPAKLSSSNKSGKLNEVGASEWVPKQNVYSKAIKEQMQNNYIVDIDGNGGQGGGGGGGAGGSPTSPVTSSVAPAAPTLSVPANNPQPTVTVTVTVPPTTYWKTEYKTVPAESIPTSSTETVSTASTSTSTSTIPQSTSSSTTSTSTLSLTTPSLSQYTSTTTLSTSTTTTSQSTPTPEPVVTVIQTLTKHVPAYTPPANGTFVSPVLTSTTPTIPTGRPTVTPFRPLKRAHWGFGRY